AEDGIRDWSVTGVQTCALPISHIDIVPTILELAGLPAPEDGELRGHSLLPDVYLPKNGEHEERDVYVDMPQGPFNVWKRAIIFEIGRASCRERGEDWGVGG